MSIDKKRLISCLLADCMEELLASLEADARAPSISHGGSNDANVFVIEVWRAMDSARMSALIANNLCAEENSAPLLIF